MNGHRRRVAGGCLSLLGLAPLTVLLLWFYGLGLWNSLCLIVRSFG